MAAMPKYTGKWLRYICAVRSRISPRLEGRSSARIGPILILQASLADSLLRRRIVPQHLKGPRSQRRCSGYAQRLCDGTGLQVECKGIIRGLRCAAVFGWMELH